MQRSIRLLTFLIIMPFYNYGSSSGSTPNSTSPLLSRVGGLLNNGLNWIYKTVDPYIPMVSDEYQTGHETVALLRNKEIAMELAFATTQPRMYINFVHDYVITTQLSDRAGPANRRIVDWLSSGNSEQLKACSECIYNFSPISRLFQDLYWSEHEVHRPTIIEKGDFGVFESVNPFLSEPEQSPLALEAIIEQNRKILTEKSSSESTISAAERKTYRRLYPEDFLLNDIEQPKHNAIYGILEASANLSRINKQPPVALLVKHLAPFMHQMACREFYIRQVAIKLLQTGAFDRIKKLYQIHRKNIPPVLAVIICDMLRATCIDAKDYLPRAYMEYYNTQNTPALAGIDPMLFKAAPKLIFLFCNDLTPEERSKLFHASESVLASRDKSAIIWTYIDYNETRRALLSRIDVMRNIPQLFARLAKFIGIPAQGSSMDASSTLMRYPTSSPLRIPASDCWELGEHAYTQPTSPIATPSSSTSPQTEVLQEGFIHQRLYPAGQSPTSEYPPLLELPYEFRPDTTPAQQQRRS